MSFILDALKKSETDRQRQAGPALYEMRVAPPRSRFPLWAMLVAALLTANVLVVSGWLWMRAGKTSSAPPAITASPPAPMPPAAQAVAATVAPALASTAAGVASAPRDPELAVLDTAPEASTSLADNDAAVETSPTERARAAAALVPNDELPTRDELHSPAIAALPELRLDLHVYDPNPLKRFVLINMHRLREAETSPEGVRVDRITAEGAELEYQGTRFFLAHE